MSGMLGALKVETAEGLRFRLGAGLSDAERRAPPPLGCWVTYRYNGISGKSGIPRFARFMRIREDMETPPGAAPYTALAAPPPPPPPPRIDIESEAAVFDPQSSLLNPASTPGGVPLARHRDHFIQHADGVCRLQAGDEVFAIHDQRGRAGMP